jgi:hypothetical protein
MGPRGPITEVIALRIGATAPKEKGYAAVFACGFVSGFTLAG